MEMIVTKNCHSLRNNFGKPEYSITWENQVKLAGFARLAFPNPILEDPQMAQLPAT